MKKPEHSILKIVYGYGFPVNNVTTCALCDFIRNHRITIKNNLAKADIKLLDAVDNDKSIENTFDDLPCYLTGNEGLRSIIANIIYAEQNICFQYEPGTPFSKTSRESVILQTAMPWEFTQSDKYLDENRLFKICKSYMTELGIPDEPLGLQEIVYEN